MRYKIDYDKTINQFVPHYMGGRKLILYLQALMYPLQQLNDSFVDWAKETRIEACMTSQIFKLEWFLNRKFGKYFSDQQSRISIQNGGSTGVPIYYESEDPETAVLYNESENEDVPAFYFENETPTNLTYSFVVNVPSPDTSKITQATYDSQLRYWIDRYKLASKSYLIKYTS